MVLPPPPPPPFAPATNARFPLYADEQTGADELPGPAGGAPPADAGRERLHVVTWVWVVIVVALVAAAVLGAWLALSGDDGATRSSSDAGPGRPGRRPQRGSDASRRACGPAHPRCGCSGPGRGAAQPGPPRPGHPLRPGTAARRAAGHRLADARQRSRRADHHPAGAAVRGDRGGPDQRLREGASPAAPSGLVPPQPAGGRGPLVLRRRQRGHPAPPDAAATLQTVPVDRERTRTIRLRLLDVTRPAPTPRGRDFTAISARSVFGPLAR